MPLPAAPDQKPMIPARRLAASVLKANNELMIKGVLCVLIGLGVLVSPYFISSPGMQGIVAKSSLVGWFALVLGCAFIGLYAAGAWRRPPRPDIHPKAHAGQHRPRRRAGDGCRPAAARGRRRRHAAPTAFRARQLLRPRLQRLRVGGLV
jgi:hypothetical protein